ncbi:hypothetical protein P154DRAFT_496168 [Amniculicola lignicola CBS 123094]|uniref:Required for respiratory growth protein 9, mitochondrial n=1 Tax=Amniculicola lignicola CBS 123094 TaxID=1392246 RepID=A0A6A5WFD3_9PLEO|nr:hypothetical protein P154DRAFT_496168 [Amniculicola lignicola CBS 123094]
MTCSSCSRKTLGLFIRSFTRYDICAPPLQYNPSQQTSRFPESVRPPREKEPWQIHNPPKQTTQSSELEPPPREREPWQIHKEALKAKLGGEAWDPRKKLSPDTQEGIRHLQQTHPDKFTTPVLAAHFKVSPEAIRRILKSKWRPSDEEVEDRLKRWDKRGERIWSNLVELGVKPPKKWREMGVGRALGGEKPKWKGPKRNLVGVNDSVDGHEEFDAEELIPIVDGRTGERLRRSENVRSERLMLDRIL